MKKDDHEFEIYSDINDVPFSEQTMESVREILTNALQRAIKNDQLKTSC